MHVATNDTDVNFVEDQQIVDALRSRKPDLAETKVYVDPDARAGQRRHTFNRRTNLEDARARRLARTAGFLEPRLDVLRVASAGLRHRAGRRKRVERHAAGCMADDGPVHSPGG